MVRRIINSTYISLDGVIQDPQLWPSSDVEDERSVEIQTEFLFGCDALLMGRRTYHGFAPVWAARSGDPFSERFNSMRKYVVSTTLRNPEWNNTTVIAANVLDEVKRLKAEPGQDIVQYGFGQLSYALMDNGLLDELRLWVHPLFVRTGGPEDLLFRAGPLTVMRLMGTTPLKSGIVILTYRPAAATNDRNS
jgi:dihydrofolate reductase